ncbi:hypothetical protein LTR81_027842, partial [Elasticomyces elasticus]
RRTYISSSSKVSMEGPVTVRSSAAAQRQAPNRVSKWAFFHDLGKDYGQWMEANGAEGRRSTEEVAARCPSVVVPEHEAVYLINRQTTTLIYYNHSIEEILE